MSASDAAPLPRLGEVFFDVRGSSRSMRLSWYADTGVAVFSIWQGGMCTGTFRLPIGDLPRMIEILERGPDEPQPRSRSREQSWGGREPARTGQREMPPGRVHYPDADGGYPDEPRTGYSQADAAETAAASYARDEPRRRGGYGIADAPSPTGIGPGRGDYPQRGGHFGAPDLDAEGYRGYDPAEPDSSAHRGGGSGYGQERFVPPYVRGAVGDYSDDIPARPGDRPDDLLPESYRAGPSGEPPEDPHYPPESWPPPGYSDRPRYRLPDTDGPHSHGRHGKSQYGQDPAGAQYDPDPLAGIDSGTSDYPVRPRS